MLSARIIVTINATQSTIIKVLKPTFFFLSDGDMKITFTERPGPRLARRFTDLLNAAVKNRFITGIAGKGDKEYIKHTIHSTFEPEYTAVKKEKSPRT